MANGGLTAIFLILLVLDDPLLSSRQPNILSSNVFADNPELFPLLSKTGFDIQQDR
jgi:hypothetical protein